MTTRSTAQPTPGKDARGMFWFDCGCHVNTLISCRCPLHAAAPIMRALLNETADALQRLGDNDISSRIYVLLDSLGERAPLATLEETP